MRRLFALVVVSLAGFVAALVAFSGQPPACGGPPATEVTGSGYDVAWTQPVTVEAGAHTLRVTREGQPVADAAVCVTAALAGQPATRVAADGEPVGDGRYRVPLELSQPGRWEATVRIDGSAAAALSFEVIAGR